MRPIPFSSATVMRARRYTPAASDIKACRRRRHDCGPTSRCRYRRESRVPCDPVGLTSDGQRFFPFRVGFLCTFVRGLVDLESHRAAIDDLAQRSIEANPFYQPGCCFRHSWPGGSSRVGFLLSSKRTQLAARDVVRFFRSSRPSGITGSGAWCRAPDATMYCSRVPLVDRDAGKAVLERFFDYCRLRVGMASSSSHPWRPTVRSTVSSSTSFRSSRCRSELRGGSCAGSYAFPDHRRSTLPRRFRQDAEALSPPARTTGGAGQWMYSALESSPDPPAVESTTSLRSRRRDGKDAKGPLSRHSTPIGPSSKRPRQRHISRRQMVVPALRWTDG